MRTTGARVDAQTNRSKLITAVGELLARDGAVGLAELAEFASISRSTTYRNFSSPEVAVDAYINEFISDFESRVIANTIPAESDGSTQIEDLCRLWGESIARRSEALIHVRSPEGFLARVRRSEPIISRIHQIVRPTLASYLPTASNAELDYAVFLWNVLLDPRELLDLAAHTNRTVEQATEHLTNDYLRVISPSTKAMLDEVGD